MTIVELLGEYGLGLDEAEVRDALEQLLGEHLVSEKAAALTEHDAMVLAQVAPEPRPGALRSATTAIVARSTAFLATGRTVDEVAAVLGVDASRVRHRMADGALYGIRIGRRRVLPTWQFDQDRPLPGLREVLASLPASLHPLEVAGFMTTPQPELEVGGQPASPQQWLAGGGSPQAVAELAGGLAVPG